MAEERENCTFDDLVVPVVGMEIRSTARMSIHEFRWIGPGKREDHGRGLFSFDVSSTFTTDPRFSPRLYPETFNALRALYVSRAVKTLFVPGIGPVLTVIDDWNESHSGGLTNGATAKISFLEDSENRFLDTTSGVSSANLQSTRDAFEVIVEDVNTPKAQTPGGPVVFSSSRRDRDAFGQILDAADAVLAFRDVGLFYSELVAAKLSLLTDLLREVHDTASHFEDPSNHPALLALKELYSAAIELVQNPTQESNVKRWTTDQQMTVMQVSSRIYKSTDRARELLALNYFENALEIPAGTGILYFSDAA